MRIVELAIKRPVTLTVGVIFILLFGFISLFKIPVQLTPDVEKPNITVETAWSGGSPNEVESEIEIVTAESAKELNTCVARGMRGYGQFTVFDDVSAGIDDGNVVLMGWVTDGFKKTDL